MSTMRLRIHFKKNRAMRFTGHLDLQHAWMRVFRRAGLLLEHSQGFHPLPKLQLASALPLGYISSGEMLDAWLVETRPIEELGSLLVPCLPPGLEIVDLQDTPLEAAKVQVALKSADYRVALPPGEDLTSLQSHISSFLSENEVIVERRGKPRDIRALVETLELTAKPVNPPEIHMRLSARESATGRPDEVLTCLGIDPLRCLVERTGLVF